jgi:glutathione peroxidase
VARLPRQWPVARNVTQFGVDMRALRALFVTSLMSLLATACTSETASPSGGAGNEGSPDSNASNGPASAGRPQQPGASAEDPSAVDPVLDPNGEACTGKAGELYALSARALGATEEIPLCRFKGAVLLVVNVASHCGYTPQYAPLEAIYEKYKAQKFYVLGFPSNSFNQESTNEQDISTFCTNEYKITFPMFAIGDVNGANTQPVYTWLKSQPDQSKDIAWNFEKFLIARDGKVANRFLTAVTPDSTDVTTAIEAELAK